jgi:hypothetical protein
MKRHPMETVVSRGRLGRYSHIDPYVRLWAAAHALEFAPDDGVHGSLLAFSMRKGPPSFDAAVTLQEWQKGSLKFP